MMRRTRTHPFPFGNHVPDIVEYDPRAAEFDDVDYRDVFAELTMRPTSHSMPHAARIRSARWSRSRPTCSTRTFSSRTRTAWSRLGVAMTMCRAT